VYGPSEHAAGGWHRLLVHVAGFLLLFLSVGPVAFAHPDLLLQIEELTEQLERQADNIDLLLKRGDLQRRHQSWDLARADFKRVREIQPDNKIIDWLEGRLDVESGRPDEGVQYLDRFLYTNPGHALALQNRAQGYLLLKRPLLAAQDFAAVIQASDRPAPSLFSANALALVEAGDDHHSTAMLVVHSGLMQFPAEVRLTGIGVDLSLARSDTDTASKLIEQLPAPVLKLPQWQTRQALLECQVGNEARATFWFNIALGDSPGPRHRPPLLTMKWLALLAAEPSAENCQAAAVEILQRYHGILLQ
jgi:tetratricopeptide (TPR) repeat protein